MANSVQNLFEALTAQKIKRAEQDMRVRDAAPEMLRILKAINELGIEHSMSAYVTAVRFLASEAIRKAEGKE